MKNKHQVHNLIILDESGSIDAIKKMIIEGFNELVQTIRGTEKQFPDQEHLITLVSFNGLRQKVHHFAEPVSKINELHEFSYNPDASTPLYDAIGFSVNKLKTVLHDNYNVIVNILTDGAENASKEYSGQHIKKLIEELKQNNWTFNYIGTGHDVNYSASAISINNTFVFKKNSDDIRNSFHRMGRINLEVSNAINLNKDVADLDFSEKPDDSDKA